MLRHGVLQQINHNEPQSKQPAKDNTEDNHLSHIMTKQTKWHVRPAKTQIMVCYCERNLFNRLTNNNIPIIALSINYEIINYISLVHDITLQTLLKGILHLTPTLKNPYNNYDMVWDGYHTSILPHPHVYNYNI